MNSIITIDDPERNRGTAARKALRDAVREASAARSWADAQLEWEIVGVPDIDEDHGGVCVCGQLGLVYLYRVVNRVTGAELHPIGSTCIEQHFGAAPAMMAGLATLRAVAGVTVAMRRHGSLDLMRDLTPTRISALSAEGIVDGYTAAWLAALRRRRRPVTHDEHVTAERLLRTHIAPALGGDPELEIVDISDFERGHRAGMRGSAVPPDATSVWRIGHHDGAMLAAELRGAA